MTWFSWFCLGGIAGVALSHVATRFAINTYRSWYLMVREELERLDPTNDALRKIGARKRDEAKK